MKSLQTENAVLQGELIEANILPPRNDEEETKIYNAQLRLQRALQSRRPSNTSLGLVAKTNADASIEVGSDKMNALEKAGRSTASLTDNQLQLSMAQRSSGRSPFRIRPLPQFPYQMSWK